MQQIKNELPLILASASPRRKEILEAHGHKPIILPADVDEGAVDESLFTPSELTIYLAELKATAILDRLESADWPDGCLILGVDTIVYKDRIIGKPIDEEDSLRILRSLKNSSHEVISGVCLLHAGPVEEQHALTISEKQLFADTTVVSFGDYTDEEILEYIRANPPYDKSGSYAIQSEWGKHVLEVKGDIENVIGLPFHRLAELI